MTSDLFNDSHIDWQTLGGIEHLQYSILDIDERNKIVDLIIKFAAGRQIILHRHKVRNNTFVIQGEHRLYHADGTLKEIRPAATPAVRPAMNLIVKAAAKWTPSSCSAFAGVMVCSMNSWTMTAISSLQSTCRTG
ncbi:hypothetical protein Q9L42_009870 [Methylomarinum sp. Ch1-1]|uniref:Uncharacterized protein n=1 Tax=Methylomarinum roseum TaxID=3067653 RepID=A0AAU7NZI3_9GAMM|nr:hypothetical protein [Methylomarinum sp. Ch1-1]MDP4521446.1 hypothetical protein [Methylomarinum sp. Ch1-1]